MHFQFLVTACPIQIEAKFVAQALAKSTELVGEVWVELEFELHGLRHGLGSVHVVRKQGDEDGSF